jgi:hypothetical protein
MTSVEELCQRVAAHVLTTANGRDIHGYGTLALLIQKLDAHGFYSDDVDERLVRLGKPVTHLTVTSRYENGSKQVTGSLNVTCDATFIDETDPLCEVRFRVPHTMDFDLSKQDEVDCEAWRELCELFLDTKAEN